MGGARGRLVSSQDRKVAIELIDEACAQGARKRKACELLSITIRTIERWKTGGGIDRRKGATREIGNKLTTEERQVILDTVNSYEYRDRRLAKSFHALQIRTFTLPPNQRCIEYFVRKSN